MHDRRRLGRSRGKNMPVTGEHLGRTGGDRLEETPGGEKENSSNNAIVLEYLPRNQLA